MTRQTTGAQNLDTYYVYDDAGQLRWVVTPEGSALLGTSGTWALSDGTGISDINSSNAAKYCYIYTWDRLGRQTSRKIPGKAVEHFVYDRAGNITSLTRYSSSGSATTLSYSYTGNRRSTFAYDINGNVTNDATNSLQTSYNLLNFPAQTKSGTTVKANYSYLSDGAKASVLNASGAGYDYNGTFTYSHASGGARTLESVAFGGGRIRKNGSSYAVDYYVTDHLGSVRAIVNASGAIVEQNDFYPFGTRQQNGLTPLSTNRWRFSGKEGYDSAFGIALDDFGARRYDRTAWTSIDPLAEKYYSVSPYSYCAGNPVNFVDPEGRNIYTLSCDGTFSLYKMTEDEYDSLYENWGEGPLFEHARHIRIKDKSIMESLSQGNTVSANSNVSEMINIFKYAADVFSDREWGLYRNEDIYELTTKNNESSVITSLDNVLWKIHSHPNVEPKYKDEIDSMGFLLPDSAFNPDGSIRKGEYDVSYTGDVFNYNKNYEISNGRPCKSQVYFPVSGNCYNIVYKSIPRPIHLQR